MNVSPVIEKFNSSKAKGYLEKALSSYYFPFVTAVVTVLSTTFGLEPLMIWYICLCGAAICLCCKDVSPTIGLFMFMHVIVSMKHSPDARGVEWCEPTYMTTPVFIAQATVAILLFAGAAAFRIVTGIVNRRFKITPIFIGLCAYCTALVLNGLLSSKYYYMDTLYGLGMGAIILFTFVFIRGNVAVDETTYKRIAFAVVAFCLNLALQLVITYISLEVVQDGVIKRGLIAFGWGTYNQFGMLITMCIPSWFYLAAKMKNGWTYLFGVPFNLLIVGLSMSRQAILMSAVLTLACCIWYFIVCDKVRRIAGGIIIGITVIIVLITFLVIKEDLAFVIKDLLSNFATGSGRTGIWDEGLKKFLHNPVFGNGFFDVSATDPASPGFNGEGSGITEAVPFMCHNTIVQLLFCSGIVGTVAYLLHRTQTVLSLIANPSAGRFFIAFTVSAIILTSLLDNHLFYPLPLFIYAPLLAVFAASEKKAEEIQTAPSVVPAVARTQGQNEDCPADIV